jgi:hypothetical protein
VLANPSVTAELGDRTWTARQNSDRVFPVIVLEGVPGPS